MIAPFEGLSAEDQKLLFKMPVLVTALVAGADGKIDKREVREAIFLAHQKVKNARPGMRDYYKVMDETFEQDLKEYIKDLPAKREEHDPIIEKDMVRANDLIKTIAANHRPFAIQYYNSMKDFARHIAEASGGLGGLLSISPEEAESIKLAKLDDPETY